MDWTSILFCLMDYYADRMIDLGAKKWTKF